MTNIEFGGWGDYLGNPPLAMAFRDRIVDEAIILKIEGKFGPGALVTHVAEANEQTRVCARLCIHPVAL